MPVVVANICFISGSSFRQGVASDNGDFHKDKADPMVMSSEADTQ